MFRLLVLLSISMFLVMLIGGEDRGQLRHGLIAAAPEPPPATVAQLETEPPATAAQGDVNLASFVPLSPPVPEPAIQVSAPAPATEPAPEPVAEPVTAALSEREPETPVVSQTDALPLLFVNSNAINVREGPSTNYAVVGRLTRNEAVLAIEPAQDGWVRIRIEGDGIEGFVAARLLTDRDPSGN